jgi:hypothetical protein
MEILKTFSKRSGKKAQITDQYVQSIRFRKLLGNTRAILDLAADGSEKLHGEYIFDVRFVTALVEQVVERMGMIDFDACVLSTEVGAGLYALYDEHREIVRCRFLTPESRSGLVVLNDEPQEEPEYRLLRDALSWMTGSAEPNSRTVSAFLKTVFDTTIKGLDKERKTNIASLYPLRLKTTGMENLIGFVDVRRGLLSEKGRRLSAHDLNCRPLGLMLAEVDRRRLVGDGTSKKTEVKWLAAMNDEHLSLRSTETRGRVRLETTVSGYKSTDYIFLFVKTPTDPEEFLPDGFHIENTELGAMCWSYNASYNKMENDLIHLGRWLFGTVEL